MIKRMTQYHDEMGSGYFLSFSGRDFSGQVGTASQAVKYWESARKRLRSCK